MMSIVSLYRIENYNFDDLLDLINKSCKNINFDPVNLSGTKIAVKPNLLTAAIPEIAVTTHPDFFKAIIYFIKENNGIPVLVESPAFLSLEYVLKKCGYYDIVLKEKILVADTSQTAIIKNIDGIKYKSFHVAKDIVDADFIFNLPKMKTHSLTYFTGAVKNLFGTIHGLEKSKWHIKTEKEKDFVSFLLDLYEAFICSKRDRIISFMDGIFGLEGEGPGKSGVPVHSCVVISGSDAISVDSIAIKVAGLDSSKAVICEEGEKRKLGNSKIENINIKGDSLKNFNNSFIPPKTGTFIGKLPVSTAFLKKIIIKKPVPNKDSCTLCYQCRSICPAGAIEKSINGTTPLYNYKKCIRCYCCMEICPEGAIYLKRSIL